MEKIELSLREVLDLEAEINGTVNQKGEMIFGGLLSEKIPFTAKYWLNKLSKKLADERKSIFDLIGDMQKKYFTNKEGEVDIENLRFKDNKKEEPSEAWINYQKDFVALLDEKRELEYKPLSIDDFKECSTENRYDLVYKLIAE